MSKRSGRTVVCILLAAAGAACSREDNPPGASRTAPVTPIYLTASFRANICGPSGSWGMGGVALEDEPPVVLYTGLSDLHYAITTKSDKAQTFFDQGLRLVYGFNHDEACRAFREAAKLDPTAAMPHWGVALTLGTNYNLPAAADRNKAAYEAVQTARSLGGSSGGATQKEKDLIEAISKRYSNPPPASAEEQLKLDQAYASAMREVSKKYADDLDIATMFAESMMNLRPWDLWAKDGKPHSGTEEIVATLERVMAARPDHPGANHYYIHAVEASPNAEKGVASAKRLESLAPAAGHLVHMPAHIYLRVGDYGAASASNRSAIAADDKYLAGGTGSPFYSGMYAPHNHHFLCFGAMMSGRKREALTGAAGAARLVTPEVCATMPPMEFWRTCNLPAMVRFGMWDEILAEPRPPESMKYGVAMWQFARGFTLIAKGKLDDAAKELDGVRTAAAAASDSLDFSRNSPKTVLSLAESLLGARLAWAKGKDGEAERLFESAISDEDKLSYMEPPDWLLPVRHAYGAFLLDRGRAADAEAVYRTDLRWWRDNPWALRGLADALRAKGAPQQEIDGAEARFKKSAAGADTTITKSWM